MMETWTSCCSERCIGTAAGRIRRSATSGPGCRPPPRHCGGASVTGASLDSLIADGPVALLVITRVYRNSGAPTSTFSDIGAGLPGLYDPSVAWGDYDNDGNLDILLTGYEGTFDGNPISRV